MGPKIEVKDRVSTYPGRVVLTPVSGAENTYDMVRADDPTVEGTPINKALLDNKAYTLKENITLYVSTSGSNSGDGSVDAPFNTIQKAIDAIPKHLGGYTARIDIADGVYEESVSVVSFSSGRLVIGNPDRNVTLRQIRIINSSMVEVNIKQFTKSDNFSGDLFIVEQNSEVTIGCDTTLDGLGKAPVGINAIDHSTLSVKGNIYITVINCNSGAVVASNSSHITLYSVTGSNNVTGVVSTKGSFVSYYTNSVVSEWGEIVSSGSIMVTGNTSTDFVDSSVF